MEKENLFLILNTFIVKQKYKTGTCSYLFLIFYGFFRIISEFFREPESPIGYLFNLFSMGKILSFLMILAGMTILLFVRKTLPTRCLDKPFSNSALFTFFLKNFFKKNF